MRYTANYSPTDSKSRPTAISAPTTKLNPYESPYDEYGDLVKAFYFNPEDPSTTSQGFQANPLYNATLSSFSTARTQNLRNTVDAKWEITPDFYVSGQFNVDIESSQSDRLHLARRRTVPQQVGALGSGEPTAWAPAKGFNYDGKIVLNYGRSLDSQGSGFVINAGTDIQHTNLTSSYVTAMGFLKDELSDIKYALG